MIKSLTKALVFFLLTSGAYGQFQFLKPAERNGSPGIKDLVLGKAFKDGETWDHGKAQDFWCSSFLRAEGSPPPKPGKDLEIEEAEAMNNAYIQWTDTYSPMSLVDGSLETAWVEGAEGPGLGETVMIPLESPWVKIYSGFQKNPSLFKRNSRPEYINIWILKAQKHAGQFGYYYTDILPVASISLWKLADTMDPQFLPIPAVWSPEDPSGEDSQYLVAIQIETVYPGTHYQDTCISEIEFIHR